MAGESSDQRGGRHRRAPRHTRPAMLLRAALAGCVVVVVTLLAAGCGERAPAPQERGATRAIELDDGLARALDAALDERRELHEQPGIAAAVVLPGGDVWSGASGVADRRTRRPLEARTPFAIASVTKTFVATLVVKLAEDGQLSLDDRLSRWLPRYPGAAGITLRQLLNHTSGLSNVDENKAYTRAVDRDPSRRWTPARTLRYVGEPHFKPGESWYYSDTGYVLLGQVVERATGSTVAAELHRRVLDPLGLRDLWLQPEERPRGRAATAYGDPDGDGETAAVSDDSGYVPYKSIASTEWTSGGMVGDAESVARFGAALFGGKVVAPASLAQMRRFVTPADIGYDGYGLGFGKVTANTLDNPELWASLGLSEGHMGALVHAPRDGVTVAFFQNDTTLPNFADVIETLLRTVLDHQAAKAR